MPHLDAPGLGHFGGDSNAPFLSQTVEDAIAELDEEQDKFDRKENGPIVVAAVVGEPPLLDAGSGAPVPSARQPVAPSLPVAPPLGIPGGRPPGYDVGGTHGSRHRGAATLFTALATGAAGGLYFKDPRGAAIGFLGAGALSNLYHGRAVTTATTQEAKTDALLTGAMSVIGLGIAAYLGYGLFQETKKK